MSSQTRVAVPANDDPGIYKAQPSAMIGIDYDELKPETYRGCFVVISDDTGEERHEFEWWDQAELYAHSTGYNVFHLSSVDDFAADLKRRKK